MLLQKKLCFAGVKLRKLNFSKLSGTVVRNGDITCPKLNVYNKTKEISTCELFASTISNMYDHLLCMNTRTAPSSGAEKTAKIGTIQTQPAAPLNSSQLVLF